jgi:hypothetical protein
LNAYWEALQRGEAIDPERWTRIHPEDQERLEDLRLIGTLHDALQMVREDSRIEPAAGPPRTEASTLPPAAGPAAPALSDEAGDLPLVVGGYRRLRRLGGGGMGEVFEAEDCATGQRVALKLLAPHFDATEDNLERFRREGRLAATISHPRCVFVLAADEDAGQPYIVMELMPGDTLKDLVERQGPLAPEQAVRTILDVIDGLQAAHRLQVLHRDVKPSNCFLEADGRVKVGDFGLSKSLTGDASLTQAGTFLGTIHYAAPEQFKGPAAVDLRSDVYAVAATFYYLLTGQPPFADPDPATVVARKASEPVPPLRGLRPDLSPALERVVLRGLERDRERRWRDLAEFRRALLPFLPGHLSAGGLGLRVGAYLIDSLLLSLFGTVARALLLPAKTGLVVTFLLEVLPPIAYFGLLEGVWGCSLAKRLLRLRVYPARGNDPPGLYRVLLRTLIFHALWLPLILAGAALEEFELPSMFVLGLAYYPLGVLLTVSTMRARNGYRGPHEFLSGTRVVQLPWPEHGPSFPFPSDRPLQLLSLPDILRERVGPFVIRGAIADTAAEKVLLGEDEVLRRQVWVRLRPFTESSADSIRREVRRSTRLRWLAGGRHVDLRWDVFLAPAGCPLPGLFKGQRPFRWREVRPILEQLTEELAAAERDGTMPACLTVAQVWVQPDGRVQLLDTLPGGPAPETTPAGTGPEGALSLLRQVAVLALEGRPWPTEAACVSVRAPLPLHVRPLLNRLIGLAPPYERVEEFQADLAATRHLPAEVTPDRRAAHLAVLGALLFFGLVCMFGAAFFWSFVMLGALDERILEVDAWRRILDDKSLRNDLAFKAPAVRGVILDRREQEFRQLQQELRQRHQKTRQLLRELIPFKLKEDLQKRATRCLFLRYTLGLLLPDVAGEVSESTLRQQLVEWERIPVGDLAVEVTRHTQDGVRIDQYAETDLVKMILSPSPTSSEVGSTPEGALLAMLTPAMICTIPLLWLFWAFVFRGGLSLRLMGLALVRADGRKALRLQCAWRALLVWAPVTALLLATASLDYLFWATEGEEPPAWWVTWLPPLTWWLALGLLVAYFVLAFRRPTRSLHDRLAGTYLVPR